MGGRGAGRGGNGEGEGGERVPAVQLALLRYTLTGEVAEKGPKYSVLYW
jgi:hypothetical protein